MNSRENRPITVTSGRFRFIVLGSPRLKRKPLGNIDQSESFKEGTILTLMLKKQVKLKPHSMERVRRFFADLGPGLITGAADDDPSGISTYSVTGAVFGYMPLWTALFSFPLMAAVQLMCARLGLVTGRGLAGVVRRNYPRSVLWGACALLIVANVFNIGADLGGMAEATEMMTGIKSYYWTPFYTHTDYLTALFLLVPSHRAHLQMADSRPLRLRCGSLPRPAGLGRRLERDPYPAS